MGPSVLFGAVAADPLPEHQLKRGRFAQGAHSNSVGRLESSSVSNVLFASASVGQIRERLHATGDRAESSQPFH